MSFTLALPKISLHGSGAIVDMVKLVATKKWGKAFIVTDGQLVKLGLLDSLFAALDANQFIPKSDRRVSAKRPHCL